MAGISQEQFVTIRKMAGGINSFDDPQDIADVEVADALNMNFRNGYPETRKGSTLAWEKPEGETNDFLCFMNGKDSSGNNHLIAVYAPNFYILDEDNDQWIKINDGYTPDPANASLMYSYQNWNAGRPNDVLYTCNGTESFIKWPIALAHVATAASSGGTSLVLDDSTHFPSSGDIVIKESGNSEIYISYNANSSNTLTLTTPLPSDVGVGAGVTFEIAEETDIPSSKVMGKNKGRLVVANGIGSETTVSYSEVGDPENFTPGSAVNDPGFEVITDGEGDVVSLEDFGEYIGILKGNSAYKLSFSINQDLDAKLAQITPIYGDISMGPITPWSVIKKNNVLFYPTATEGILSLSPDITGGQTSVSASVLSQKMQDYITALNFENSRVAGFRQFIFWSAATDSAIDVVMVYDVIRKCWTKYNNWGVKDWIIYNDELYFGSTIDNNVYKVLTDDGVDMSSSDLQSQYESYILTKRYDFGKPSKQKSLSYVHIQGYISETTTLNFDIMYGEGGKLQTITKTIDGTDDLIYQPITEAMAMVMLGIPMMGSSSITDLDSIGLMDFYIPVPIRYGVNNIQVKIYSNSEGSYWGLTGIGFNPFERPKIAQELVLNS